MFKQNKIILINQIQHKYKYKFHVINFPELFLNRQCVLSNFFRDFFYHFAFIFDDKKILHILIFVILHPLFKIIYTAYQHQH